jgi:uncharacterized membrane protein YfcA
MGLNGDPSAFPTTFATLSDLLDPTLFAAVVADRRFAVAAAIALVSGAARGFSGFGSAMIYIPLVAAVYEPRTAAATMVLIDLVCAFPLAVRAVPHCSWREVTPISIAAAVAVPIGTWVLLVADPVMLRWVIAGVVILLLAVLASGWRYHGRPRLPATIGVGLLSGLASAAVQIAGPPVILYWLGGAAQAAFVRANLMVYFTFIDVIGCAAYFREGLFTREVAVLSLLLGLPFILAMVAGARSFRLASERSFRRVAYAIIAVSALISLPLFDRLLR